METNDRRPRIDGERPTAEDMLERWRREARESPGRGRLRVYLGAAPGVGKTYAMLHEGHRLRKEGRDVVIGFVETYGRAETEAQIGDLEVIPRRRLQYRGVTLEEMDTDAVLRRRPAVALVDELAHTNAPGSPRQKRYQDIEVLRSAGIDVITTLNVQHLESVNDLVESITGVKVRETVPDRLLDEASVELVDLPAPLLRERLAAGKIYPREQVQRALEHFFRESNLTALRELALRRTAEGVEAALEAYMRGERAPGPWPTVERVLVAIDHRPHGEALIRAGWRTARGLHADLIVAMVIPAPLPSLPEAQRRALMRRLELAEDLGAETMTIVDRDVAAGIMQAVRAHAATDLVIGRPQRRRPLGIRRDAVLKRLLRDLPDVHIHIMSPPHTAHAT